jgi:hypothetical protein
MLQQSGGQAELGAQSVAAISVTLLLASAILLVAVAFLVLV